MENTIRRRILDIQITKPYGVVDNGHVFDLEPTDREIQEAIDNDQLEEREFSGEQSKALVAEWSQCANGDEAKFYELQRAFHAQRIARFVIRGWKNPIEIKNDGELVDGGHRFRAARFLKMDEIHVRVIE